jgi:hypothetical protein
MDEIKILKTKLPEGAVQLMSHHAYLDESFFEDFKEMSMPSNDPYEDWEYKQVYIRFMRVSWITSDKYNREFLNALVFDGGIELF